MKGTFLLGSLLASTATAHMQMSKPYPIRSPLNKDSDGEKDYSYTNPLQASGSDYPCKGYAKDKFESQATYAPGQQYEMELEGSATHEGGSCQLALTYDQGETFKVIESMLGDCPIAKKYSFTVPSDAPSGDALLAWTWFNKVGNREMYMNCAMVTVGGSSNGNKTEAKPPTHKKTKDKQTHGEKMNVEQHMEHPHEAQEAHKAMEHASHPPMQHAAHPPMEHAAPAHEHKQRGMTEMMGKSKAMSFDSLPELFVANVDQAGKCVTIEGEAVNFPMPGDNVVGTADGTGYKCSGNAPFLGAGGASDSSSNSKQNATRSTKNDQSMSKIASAFGTPSADPRILSTEASTNNAFSNYVGGFSCTSGEFLCSPDGYSWAMCSNSRPIYMGPVAAGMMCRFGQMVTAGW